LGINFESTVIITDKLEEMKTFYTNVLGQNVKMDFGNCISLECGLTLWRLMDEYTITGALGYKYHNSANKNLELYFETEDFEDEIKRLKEFDIALLHDVSKEAWGQLTIRFYDPEKNLIELGESMQSFCRRLRDSGLSEKEVAKKTGIPLGIVKQYLCDK